MAILVEGPLPVIPLFLMQVLVAKVPLIVQTANALTILKTEKIEGHALLVEILYNKNKGRLKSFPTLFTLP